MKVLIGFVRKIALGTGTSFAKLFEATHRLCHPSKLVTCVIVVRPDIDAHMRARCRSAAPSLYPHEAAD